jgi:hypothetical protein
MSIEKRGGGWLARICVDGKRLSKTFDTKREARAWEELERDALEKIGQPKGDGPDQTCLGQAMRLFAESETKFKKGAKQELTRLNKWRQAAGKSLLQLVTRDDGTTTIVDAVAPPVLPRTFAEHRATRAVKSAQADTLRAQLARMPMGKITGHQLKDFQNALRDGGLSRDTIRLEMALLKRIFRV